MRVRWTRILTVGAALATPLAGGGLTSCSSGRVPEAHLEEVAPGLLPDHAALIRARRLRAEGELDDAIEAAQTGLRFEPPSEVRAELYRELSRVHITREKFVAAYRAQDRGRSAARDPRRSAEMTHELAQDFDKASLPGDALTLYRQVWTDWPKTKVAKKAYARSLQIERATGAEPSPPVVILSVADALSNGGRCDEALELYERALAEDGLEPPLRRRAEYARADCLFARKRYTEAADAYARIVESEPGADTKVRVALARTHARSGNKTLAVKQLDAVARKADPVTRARAKYLAAVLVGPPDSSQAQKRLREVERQKASPGFAKLARWRLAWSDVSTKQHATAIKRLRLMAEGDILDIEVRRAIYWLALSEIAQGNFDEGRAGLERLLEEVPLTYYGFLASDRLDVRNPSARLVLPPRTLAQAGRPDRAIERSSILVRAGFPELARLELESRVRSDRPMALEDRVGAAELFHSIGDHYRAVRVIVDGFGGALDQGIDPDWREAWLQAWPRPYREAVERVAREFSADPALLYAIMREESSYRPDAESPVGARGLMQIMPPTGEGIADALEVQGFVPDSLFQAETNIRFGSYYMQKLLRDLGGRPPLAIAAYNAGPEIVETWAAEQDPFVTDVFVDSVPYGETRRYVRRVLRSYRLYRLLYGPEKATIASPQPFGSHGR
jgi:soluble lytic murein transglycosylase